MLWLGASAAGGGSKHDEQSAPARGQLEAQARVNASLFVEARKLPTANVQLPKS
jgi:hypothetical protein